MSSRVKKPRTRVQRNTRTEILDQPTKAEERRQDTQAITEELDAILDDIDAVLQGVDQDLVDKFVQKGGQ